MMPKSTYFWHEKKISVSWSGPYADTNGTTDRNAQIVPFSQKIMFMKKKSTPSTGTLFIKIVQVSKGGQMK